MKTNKLNDKPMQGIHVYALLFFIILFACILTWIVPAGEFEKAAVEGTSQTVYLAGTYHGVESNPQNPVDMINAIFNGLVKAASTIFVIFLMGAWVKIMEDSRLITKSFGRLTAAFQGHEKIVVVLVMLLLTFLGAFGINPSIPLLPLGVLLAQTLGYDGAVAFAMIFLANYVGYGMGAYNVQSLGIAQEIAQLGRFSGAGMRLVNHGIGFGMLLFFTMRYIKRITKDPASSLTRGNEVTVQVEENAAGAEHFTMGDWLNLAVFTGGFAVILYGVVKLGWGMAKFGPVFLAMAILTGIFGGLGINGTARSFVRGCENIAYSALIVGIAGAISIVLTDGRIIDTIVYALSNPIVKAGPVLGSVTMFVSNSVINLFIPAATGQAATVMPLMTPVADIAGISRQVAVTAFQFGDGITNCIIPTSTSLFACLGICGLRYDKYVRWVLPLVIGLSVFAAVILAVLQIAQWGM